MTAATGRATRAAWTPPRNSSAPGVRSCCGTGLLSPAEVAPDLTAHGNRQSARSVTLGDQLYEQQHGLWVVALAAGGQLMFVASGPATRGMNPHLPRNPGTLSLESGTYCCDRIDIAQKCIKKVTACPVDKPITVLVP